MNKAVFITGGQSGTGFGIADFFARQWWNVIVSGQNGVEAKAAARRLAETYGIISTGYELDLRNEQQMIDIFNDIDNSDLFCIIISVRCERTDIAGLCNGSTADSDSVCEGSNPSPAAKIGKLILADFFVINC